MATYNPFNRQSYNPYSQRRMHGPSALQMRRTKPTDSVQQMLDMYDMGGSKETPSATRNFNTRRAAQRSPGQQLRGLRANQQSKPTGTLATGAYGQENQMRAGQKRHDERIEKVKSDRKAKAEREAYEKSPEGIARRRMLMEKRAARRAARRARREARMRDRQGPSQPDYGIQGPIINTIPGNNPFEDIPFGPGHPLYDPAYKSADGSLDFSRSGQFSGRPMEPGDSFTPGGTPQGGTPEQSGIDSPENDPRLDWFMETYGFNPTGMDPQQVANMVGQSMDRNQRNRSSSRRKSTHPKAIAREARRAERRAEYERKKEEGRIAREEREAEAAEARKERERRQAHMRQFDRQGRDPRMRRVRSRYGYGLFPGDEMGPRQNRQVEFDEEGLPYRVSDPYEMREATEDDPGNYREHYGTGRYITSSRERQMYEARDRRRAAEEARQGRYNQYMSERNAPAEAGEAPRQMSPMENFYAMMMGGGQEYVPPGGQYSRETRNERLRREPRRGRYRRRF